MQPQVLKTASAASSGRQAAHCAGSEPAGPQEVATKSSAPQRKCEHRQAQTDHHSFEASCLGTVTDRKVNLLCQAQT